MRVTPDRIVRGRKKLLEVKSTSGIMGDTIPDYYLAQVMYQMFVTGIHEAELIYIQGNLTFGRFFVEYDEEFAEFIADQVTVFWLESVMGGKEPELISVEDFAFKGSEPGSSVEADDKAVMELISLRRLSAELDVKETEANGLKDSIKLFMGEAESIVFEGTVLATWKSGARGRTFRLKEKNIEELSKQNENNENE